MYAKFHKHPMMGSGSKIGGTEILCRKYSKSKNTKKCIFSENNSKFENPKKCSLGIYVKNMHAKFHKHPMMGSGSKIGGTVY